jgi:F-type H+-transporting ATPase subunit epsilon
LPIELNIVTPQGEAFAGPVEQVVLPGAEGRFGVLEAHERFLAPLKIGAVEIISGSGSQWAAIADGFAEVNGEQVTVLVDECQLSGNIDSAGVAAKKSECETELAQLSGSEEDERRRAEIRADVALLDVKQEVAGK